LTGDPKPAAGLRARLKLPVMAGPMFIGWIARIATDYAKARVLIRVSA
jgi:hypothetical protein